MPQVTPLELSQLCDSILRNAGATEREAKIVSRHLVDANLTGHDSHGVMRVMQYVQEIETGYIVPGTTVNVVNEWATGAVVDATGVFGQVACLDAMQQAINKAKDAGIASIAVRSSGHSGRLGTYAEAAAEAGVLGIIMANGGGAGQWVTPYGGCERRLSTNPIAIGAPSAGDFPYLVDISTSVAPEGKVRDCLQKGTPVPTGWLVDHDGNPTTDPSQLYAELSGALLPFGGLSGHKGFALGFMVDVFAGALTTAGCPGPERTSSTTRSGLFMMAVDIERFTPLNEFRQRVTEMANYMKSSRPAAGFDSVLVPGEPEHLHRIQKQKHGITLPDSVWTDLNRF